MNRCIHNQGASNNVATGTPSGPVQRDRKAVGCSSPGEVHVLLSRLRLITTPVFPAPGGPGSPSTQSLTVMLENTR
jgi:hypothetical protein